MIRTIEIKNFRCYQHLRIENCARINVIVGDNGSGKTTLLEAIFMTLATASEVALRLRSQRGLDAAFQGTAAKIEEAFWSDFFHNGNLNNPIMISLKGDGAETRSLKLARTNAEVIKSVGKRDETVISGPVAFTWQPHRGGAKSVVPRMTGNQLAFPDTGEDHPNFFHYPASNQASSIETAGRFSDLSKEGKHLDFITSVKDEYPIITDMSIEVIAGLPAIFASVQNSNRKIPLANISGGINKVFAILLGIASQPKSVITIDELEDGIYYKHLEAVWRRMLSITRTNKAQVFVATHSLECLQSLVKAAKGNTEDIALWRIERDEQGKPELLQFDGEALEAGIKHDVEVRGSANDTDS